MNPESHPALPFSQNLESLKNVQALVTTPAQGWLRAMRTGQGLSQQRVAERIRMTRQAYADLEAAERRGAISLKSLQRAAGAMDCDFVGFIVPRSPSVPGARPQADAPRPHPTGTSSATFVDSTTDELLTELK